MKYHRKFTKMRQEAIDLINVTAKEHLSITINPKSEKYEITIEENKVFFYDDNNPLQLEKLNSETLFLIADEIHNLYY